MSEPQRPCPQCGSVVLPLSAAECPRCGAAVPPPLPEARKPPDIESWFEGPDRPAWEPPLPEPTAPELVILDEPAEAVPEEVPVVHPARAESLPEARPLPAPRPAEVPRPPRPSARVDEPAERPRPQVALAMTVVLLLILATCAGAFVLVYAIWAGFKRMAPKRTEVPADVRPVPALRGSPATR